ncbi:MAG TPA: hypothetical protein PKG81_03320, partial [Candidatus Omnitrophota bacterium]|nr:hypothetical protein [Candidatus Omnitrophota bacterium]
MLEYLNLFLGRLSAVKAVGIRKGPSLVLGQEDLFSIFLGMEDDAAVVIDPAGKIIYANNIFIDRIGRNKRSVLGADIRSLFPLE